MPAHCDALLFRIAWIADDNDDVLSEIANRKCQLAVSERMVARQSKTGAFGNKSKRCSALERAK